jgi:hypothetical protein
MLRMATVWQLDWRGHRPLLGRLEPVADATPSTDSSRPEAARGGRRLCGVRSAIAAILVVINNITQLADR